MQLPKWSMAAAEAPPPSGYLTLIPLSGVCGAGALTHPTVSAPVNDSNLKPPFLPSWPPPADARLQPRDSRITALLLLCFACVVAGAVFVSVPRGFSIGEVRRVACLHSCPALPSLQAPLTTPNRAAAGLRRRLRCTRIA